MYLVAIAWMYVVVMMSVAEATAQNGTVLGAIITFFLYGVLPCVILMYLMGTPMRRRKIRAQELADLEQLHAQAALSNPDTGSEAPADAIPAVRKEV
jgi:mannose/fructose/N-acetylgalactosamine-specific phosphotransferase system component IID